MNLEQQQQSHHQQNQIHQLTSAATTSTPTPTTTTNSEYANINICDGMPILHSSAPSMATPSSNATFVTIGMLTAPMQQQHQQHNTTHSTISPSSTSTFKTPLLPMPSLEDIEGSLLLTTPHAIENEQMQSQSPAPQQPQYQHQHQHHQQPQHQPIPGGILKYPPPPAVTNTITLGLPLGLGPGPGPPMQQHQQHHQQQHQQPSLLNDQQSTFPPSPPLILPQTAATLQPTPTTAFPPNDCSQNMSAGILRNNLTSTTATASTLANNATATLASKAAIKSGSVGSSNLSATSNSNLRSSKPTNTKRKCCCFCFGSNSSSNQSSGSTINDKKSSAKKHKRKTKTFWSALLTNLGICALLLAYTLLGSFIFLTIESEDSMLMQRTLASTKRVGGGNGNIHGRGGVRTKSVNNNNNNNNLYHSQIQQQQQRRLDNGTLTAAAATSSLSSFNAASSASSSSSHPSYSSAAVLEGIVPLSNVDDGVDGAAAIGGGHNDFTYANDNDFNDDNDILAGGDDDGAASQFALSADTYDVRQRTIENIWDITVSLNILYKENWTKLAALEIAKFQDQLIKRLNEDTLLQLSHDIDDGNGAAAGVAASAAGGGNGGGSNLNGNSPATEAVLLHSHQQHYQNHLHHYHHHRGSHEWNFARAFLYSLTVLTTIGYGNIAPRTTLGRLVTLAYAIFGIPLTLVYLSSTGGLLAKVAREVFSKALCCCLCSNCGYCCYDERRMAEKERRMKRKRQQEELRKQQAAMQEPYYVRSGSMTESSFQTPEKQQPPSTPGAAVQLPDIDSLSASESRGSMHGLSILAPILLCLSMMIIYIVFGALVLYRLEEWPILDGIYFCFMSLSTIGFGDMLPSLRRESTTTTWFCSIYIMSGMALTAMCFNVIHEEIVHRIRIVVEFKQANGNFDATNEEQHIGGGGIGGGGGGGGVGGGSSYYIAS